MRLIRLGDLFTSCFARGNGGGGGFLCTGGALLRCHPRGEQPICTAILTPSEQTHAGGSVFRVRGAKRN